MLMRARLNGLTGLVVAHGPPVAHPCFRQTNVSPAASVEVPVIEVELV